MVPTSACPDARQWQRLLLGQIPEEESEALEQHLSACGACLQAVRSIRADDPLADALRSRSTAVEVPIPEALQRLMDGLKQLRPSGESRPDTEEVLGAALGVTPALAAQPSEDLTVERHDFLAPPQEPGELGRLGPYRVLKVLGTGGMGVVFQAEDPHLRRPVALKVMKPALAASATARKRFLREGQAMAALEHDHIVPVYQVGEDRGLPFLAMQLLKGETLEDRLQREPILPPAEVWRIGREMAEGLAAAHASGLIHRDIKPANVWLEGERARVKILDFGLARAEDEESHLTQTGVVAGTPAYMAPEQARGEKVDARCDLFSLGCVLYRLCTGEKAFKGTNPTATLLSLTQDQPRPPRELNPAIPQELSDLVMSLLAKDPGQRPASDRTVIEAIEGMESSLREVPTQPAPAPPGRWLPWAIAAAAALGGALLLPQAILRVTGREGKVKQEIALEPGDRVEMVAGERASAKPVPGPLDRLDPALIPAEERFAWQPKELVAVLGTHSRRHHTVITSLAYSPDSKWIACGTPYGIAVSLFEAATMRRRALPLGGCLSLAFSPDSRTLAGAGDKSLLLWDLSGPEPRLSRRAQPSVIHSIAYAPGGKVLATGDRDGVVRVWDPALAEPRPRAELKGHTGPLARVATNLGVTSLAFSGDGKLLASLSDTDQTIRLWDLSGATPKEKAMIRVSNDPNAQYRRLALSPDGKTLALCNLPSASLLRLWDLGKDEPSERPFPALPSSHLAMSVAFSQDGRTVAVGAQDGFGLWDLSGKPRLTTWHTRPDCQWVELSADGRALLTAGQHFGVVRQWDVTGAEPRERLPLEGAHWGQITSLASVPGEPMLFSGARDGTVRAWDLRGTRPRERAVLALDGAVGLSVWALGGSQPLAVARSALWDLSGQKAKERLKLPMPVQLAAFSTDRCTLALANSRTAQLVDLREARPKGPPLLHDQDIIALALSANGHLLACAQRETVRLWNLSGPKRTFHDLPAKVVGARSTLAFSPDSQTLVIHRLSGDLQVWDLSEETPKVQCALPAATYLDLNFSPDGNALVGCNQTHGAFVWDATTWKPTRKFLVHGGVSHAAFVGDSRHLALGNVNGTIYILRLAPPSASAEPPGTLTLETPEAGVRVFVDGQERLTVDATRAASIDLPPGDHELTVRRGEAVVYSKKLTLRSGGREAIAAIWPLPGPLDRLDPKTIPAEERFAWQPKELVAVLGTHRYRHFRGISEVAWSPDGKWVACVGAVDSTVSLFDATLRRHAVLDAGEVAGARALAFSSDSRTLAWGHGGEVIFADLTAARPRLIRRKHPGRAWTITYAPDGKTLATGGSDGLVRLWDARMAEPLPRAVVRAHASDVHGLALAGAGKTWTLASLGGNDQTVRLWHVTGEEVKERPAIKLTAEPGDIYRELALSPDGGTLAVGNLALPVPLRLWDLTGADPKERRIPGGPLENNAVRKVAFSRDGRTVAVGCVSFAHLWDLSGEPRLKASLTWKTPAQRGYYSAVAISPDGQTLLTGGEYDGLLRKWKLVGDTLQERLPQQGDSRGAIQALASVAGEPTLVSAGMDATVRIWDLGTAKPRQQSVMVPYPVGGAPIFLSAGSPLLVVAADSVWDLSGARRKMRLKLSRTPTGAVFSADRSTLAFVQRNEPKTVRLCDLRQEKPTERQISHSQEVAAWALSGDGRLLACAQRESVRLWDLSGPAPRYNTLATRVGAVRGLAFSPDSRTLVVTGQDEFLQVWDIDDSKASLRGMYPAIPKIAVLAFSPDGKALVGVSPGYGVTVWSTTTWRIRHQWLLGAAVNTASFVGDSRHLALGNINGTIYILRLAPPSMAAAP
jgi:WD40 repeat protein